MNESLKNTVDTYLRLYTTEYMEKVFYFCLKKCGQPEEAENLTSDISLNIIAALQSCKGQDMIPTYFSAWVWKIARNRYSVWADQKHKRMLSVSGADLSEFEIAEESSFEDALIQKEQLQLLRRELAFIRSDYRSLIVAYYLENRRIEEIAHTLGIPKGTIMTRLHRSRKILKEGMNMAREFGVKSYNPQEIGFINNGMSGDKGQPWSILNHSLYKNIFLEAYGNPSTAQTLAIELGIALPYMQDELDYLEKETFLIKSGDLYETAFPIVSQSVQERVYARNMAAVPEITALLTRLIDLFDAACREKDMAYYGGYQDYESAKWTLLMQAYDRLMYGIGKEQHIRTKRPDNGRWDIVGFQHTTLRIPPFVGLHMCTNDEIQFGQFKFMLNGIDGRTPLRITEEEAAAIRLCVLGRQTECAPDVLERVCGYGYLRKKEEKEGEIYLPTVIVFNEQQLTKASAVLNEAAYCEITGLVNTIQEKFSALSEYTYEEVRKDLPTRFREDDYQCRLAASCSTLERGYVLEQALKTGWLKPSDQVCYTIGAYIIL